MKLEPGIVRIALQATGDVEAFAPDKWCEERIWNIKNVNELSSQGASSYIVVLLFDSLEELNALLSTRVGEINDVIAEWIKRPLCQAPVSIWTCNESLDPGKKWCVDHEWLEEEEEEAI